jgi:hypothetical protein
MFYARVNSKFYPQPNLVIYQYRSSKFTRPDKFPQRDNEDSENDILAHPTHTDSALAEHQMFLVQSDICKRANQIRKDIHVNI